MICTPLSVAFVAVHYTRRAVFPTPQLCFRRVMACACDHTPHTTSTVVRWDGVTNFYHDQILTLNWFGLSFKNCLCAASANPLYFFMLTLPCLVINCHNTVVLVQKFCWFLLHLMLRSILQAWVGIIHFVN